MIFDPQSETNGNTEGDESRYAHQGIWMDQLPGGSTALDFWPGQHVRVDDVVHVSYFGSEQDTVLETSSDLVRRPGRPRFITR